MNLIEAINKHQTFKISQSGEVQKIGLISRIRRHFDQSYETNRTGRIAQVLTETLQSQHWQNINESNHDPLVIATRKFLRKHHPQQGEDPRITTLRCQHLAAKLNIPRSALELNPDFALFAKKQHLDRYLLYYQYELQVTQENIINIPTDPTNPQFNNQPYISWDDVPDEIRNPVNKPDVVQEPWVFGQNGLQIEDMFDWTEMKPYKKEDPAKWGNQYVFEYCVSCEDSVRLQGDHAWFRLKTPEGDIYCVGLYRPNKRGKRDNYHLPFRVKEGYLMQPDMSEFWPDPIHRTEIAISQNQFEQIIWSVEMDKRTDNQNFLLLEANCTEYTNRKARMAGIQFPTSHSAWKFISPKWLNNALGKLPKTVRKIGYAAIVPLGNLITLSLGSGTIDSKLKTKLKERNITIKAHLHNFWDLFKPEKLLFHPPIYVHTNVFPKVQEWRDKEQSQLEQEYRDGLIDQVTYEERIKEIAYAVPPEHRV